MLDLLAVRRSYLLKGSVVFPPNTEVIVTNQGGSHPSVTDQLYLTTSILSRISDFTIQSGKPCACDIQRSLSVLNERRVSTDFYSCCDPRRTRNLRIHCCCHTHKDTLKTENKMPVVKLTYFNIRGRAEPVRIMFEMAGVKYEDIRVSREDFETLKPSE